MMTYRISVELALGWRWRCEADNQIFSGSRLCVIDRYSGALNPLAGVRHSEVDRAELHHACGSDRVVAVAPDPDYRPLRGKT